MNIRLRTDEINQRDETDHHKHYHEAADREPARLGASVGSKDRHERIDNRVEDFFHEAAPKKFFQQDETFSSSFALLIVSANGRRLNETGVH